MGCATEKDAFNFGEGLGKLSKLTSLVTFSLNLDSNNVLPLFAVLLGKALQECRKNLISFTLDLSNTATMHRSTDERNAVLDEGACALARGLGMCRKLEFCSLNLQGNAIEDEGGENFAKCMTWNNSLQVFKMNLLDNAASSLIIESGLREVLPKSCKIEVTMGVSETEDDQPT